MLWRRIILMVLVGACLASATAAEKTKKLSGKIRSVQDNVISIEKAGLVSESIAQVSITSTTRITGQLKPGLRISVRYTEEGEKNDKGERRKVAVEIETRPEYASKEAKKAAKNIEKR